jgi:drug/metabolite transporter (DMT)-like permease
VTELLLPVGQFSFVYAGLSHGVPAGLSSLILGMAPLLVGLLTPLVLATRLGLAPVLGLLIGACGVYIVLSDGLGAVAPRRRGCGVVAGSRTPVRTPEGVRSRRGSVPGGDLVAHLTEVVVSSQTVDLL